MIVRAPRTLAPARRRSAPARAAAWPGSAPARAAAWPARQTRYDSKHSFSIKKVKKRALTRRQSAPDERPYTRARARAYYDYNANNGVPPAGRGLRAGTDGAA